jgi:hypothetical protein
MGFEDGLGVWGPLRFFMAKNFKASVFMLRVV